MPVLKIKKTDGTWQEVWGAIADTSSVSAPKLTSVTMRANAWQGISNPYSQVVTCSGVNVNSKLDLQPTPTQIVELQDAEISLMLTNNQGISHHHLTHGSEFLFEFGNTASVSDLGDT